ncbi:gag-pol polyprotein [Tanacetum coccineum]
MKQQADKSRPEREFDIWDMVFLKLQAHRQVTIRMGNQNKFSQKFYGPFEVSVKLNTAYPLPSDTARNFKTLSLDKLRSLDFNLFFDQEYSEEEEAEAMAETMEQYMSKTRTDYGSGVDRPKIGEKDSFELKGQILKELQENTFSGSDNEDANEHIEKVLEIVDLFHVPNIIEDQLMLRVFPISLTRAVIHWLRNKPTGSIKTWEYLKTKFLNKYCPLGRTAKKMEEINNSQQEPDETLYQAWEHFKELLMKYPQHYLTEMPEVILFYNRLDVPTRQILDSRGAVPTKTVVDAKKAIQEMAEYSQKWHNETSRRRITETSDGLAAIQAQLNNLGREIKKKGSYGLQFLEAYSKTSHTDESIPQKEKDPGSFTLPCFINNVCFDNALVDLGASVSVMTFLTYLNLGLDMPEDIKVPLILGRSFLSTAHAKIYVYKRKITLRVREEKIIFKSVKPASSLIKRVYMLTLKERMELDLEAKLMGETLVISRSLDTLNGYYIELNDLNEPFELRRNQSDDLMPTIKEGGVIKEFRTRDGDLDTRIDDYPSYCDDDKKIHIDCAHNLKFSCMIGFEFTHVNFFPLLYVNVMSKKFHNSIMKDKMVYKGDNVVGALMNVPIFVGTFSIVTNFAVLEDMDDYRDEGMGDVFVGEPFLREVGIKARRLIGLQIRPSSRFGRPLEVSDMGITNALNNRCAHQQENAIIGKVDIPAAVVASCAKAVPSRFRSPDKSFAAARTDAP